LALRAVIFDYGVVLSGPADAHSHSALLRLTGLPNDRFEELYWTDRKAYDQGVLDDVTYWKKFFTDAKLLFDNEIIPDLIYWDAHMWGNQDPVMVAWQADLKKAGLLTAILSNMGDAICSHVMFVHKHWINRFDTLVWSYQVNLVKPDPAIYRLTLERLGTMPDETLFIDDKKPNVDAARALGIRAIQYFSIDRLYDDLAAMGLDTVLPLPGCPDLHRKNKLCGRQ
jgi:putative hydrolase of the HAD superfamily